MEGFRGDILIAGTRAPAAIHLLHLLLEAGENVGAADSLKHPLSRGVHGLSTHVRYPRPRQEPEAFAEWCLALSRSSIQAILPANEDALHFSERAKSLLGPRLLTPPIHVLERAHSKFLFADHLSALGLPSPKTSRGRGASLLDGWTHPLEHTVFKPEYSRFGTQTLLGLGVGAPHPGLIDPTTSWVLQERLLGREVCATGFAHSGRLAAFSSYHPKYRAGLGAGIYFEPDSHHDLRDIVEAYVAATEWTGFIGMDAIVDAAGHAIPIECNPRLTSGLHLFQDAQSFARALRGETMATPNARARRLPLFLFAGAGMKALFHGRVQTFIGDMTRAGNGLSYGPRRLSHWAMLQSFLELCAIARQEKISPIEASTHDIEWTPYRLS